MNTPNQLSVTPRTDAAWAKTFEDDDDQCRAGNAASDMREECAQLERELAAERAELVAERARLDYLLQWDVTFHDRADIDAELSYAQRKKSVPTLP
jgi:hypothetical protein